VALELWSKPHCSRKPSAISAAIQPRADWPMLALVRLPLELLCVAVYIFLAAVDSITGRRRRRFQSRVLIKAPRDAVCGFVDSQIGLDETKGTARLEIMPRGPSPPPAACCDYYFRADLEAVPGGTALTLHVEVTFGSFGQRIRCPVAVRQEATRIKWHCEKEAGAQSQLAELANHWLVLSCLALLSFWYLWGWREALLIALVVVLHELGHAAAMQMVGIPVQGIYLIPFLGGAAVPKTAYRSLGQLGFVTLMGPGFSLIPTLALAWLYYKTADTWALHAAFMFALINGGNLLPIYPLDGGQILNAVLSSLSRHIANAAAWVGVLTGLGAALYLQSLLLGIPFLFFALQLAPSGTRTAGLRRLTSLSGAALVLAFVATFALYLATFLYANNIKSVLAGGAVGPLEASVGIPVRCDLPASSTALLERLLSEPGGLDALSFIRLLAQADRAGHGDIVRRWLEAPGFNPPPDLGSVRQERIAHWLALARSGSLGAIEAEIAGSPTYPGYTGLRVLLTAALLIHARYQVALALLPPPSEPWKRWSWLEGALIDLVLAGATTEALSLLHSTRADTVDMGYGKHLVALATTLQRVPAAFGDKREFVAVLADQLHAFYGAEQARFHSTCPANTSPACPDEKRRLAIQHRELDWRDTAIELLAGFGRVDFDLPDEFLRDPRQWWDVIAVFAASLAEQGSAAKAEALRNLVKGVLPAKAQATGQATTDSFEIAYATMRILINLSRGDSESAEALAQAAMHRFGLATSIRNLMVDHYLWAGDWPRADAWNKRDLRVETRVWFELAYQMNLAAAAAEKAQAALADRAFERARTIACERASVSAHLRYQWSTFLRRAYLLKAFQEGRLPPYALDRP
jgi:Zn-dependent protease